MTAFAEALRTRIGRDGPITVERFMAEALAHYYGSRDPLGRAGDFTTAPEISQIFGELIALFLAQSWRDAGAPTPVQLVELGPGRGTLMRDIRRTLAKAAPDLARAAQIHLVETSPALHARQEVLLGPEIHWHRDFGTIPRGPLLLVANEFFDALPIRQFVVSERGPAERCVGLDKLGRFGFTTRAPPPHPSPTGGEGVSSGTIAQSTSPSLLWGGDRDGGTLPIVETSPAREAAVALIARRIAREGGTALIIDYGPEKSAPGDTLQAVKAHRFAEPLEEPGEADLTAHVDFEALGRAAREAGAEIHGPVTQGAFLNALGLPLRAKALKAAATAEAAAEIDTASARLTDAAQMGSLFKVMALTRIGAAPLAGFPR